MKSQTHAAPTARPTPAHTPERFLRLKEVKERTGLCRTNVYVLSQRGQFPTPVRLGGRAIAWVESEVNTWMEDRKTSARAGVQATEARRA